MLPEALGGLLTDHLRSRRELYERDLQRNAGYVPLPDAVANKAPANEREWGWQYVFASVTARYAEAPDGTQRGVRWHTTPAHVSRTMVAAARAPCCGRPALPLGGRRSVKSNAMNQGGGIAWAIQHTIMFVA